jgi:hypothetical protein
MPSLVEDGLPNRLIGGGARLGPVVADVHQR